MASTAAGAPLAPAIFTSCVTGLRAAGFYCITLGASLPGGGPSLLSRACDTVVPGILESIDRAILANEVFLSPSAKIPGVVGLFPAIGQTVPATGPFPSFTINVDEGCEEDPSTSILLALVVKNQVIATADDP